MQPRILSRSRSLLALTLLVALAASLVMTMPRAQADEAVELVVNGDFTDGTAGWRTNSTDQRLRVVTRGDQQVAELTTDTPGHAVLNDRVNTILDTGEPGQTYQLIARVRTTTPDISGALRVREVTPQGAHSHESTFRLRDTTWHTVELAVTTSRSHAWLDINVTAWRLAPGENLQIDLVSARHVDTASEPTAPVAPAPAPAPTPNPAPAPAPTPSPAPAPAPAPAPQPGADRCHVEPSGDTLFGASISSSGGLSANESLAEVDRLFGSPSVIRHFSPGLPFEWDSPRAELLEDRTAVLSFKADPRDITSGRHDTFFREWFAAAPNDQVIYWSYFHEPENNINRGEFTAAQYRAAWKHLAAIADEFCKPNMHSTLILTEWTMNPSSKRDYRTYDAGHDVIDVLAFDPYNGASDPGRDYYRPASDLLGNIIAAMDADGRPWGIAEIGSRLIPGDSGQGRAAWLTDVGELLVEHDALFATYFHSTSDGNWRLDDRHSAAAWRNLVN